MEKVKYPEPGGKYRHYKGGVYEFLFMAPHSETGDKLVIYKSVLSGHTMLDRLIIGILM